MSQRKTLIGTLLLLTLTAPHLANAEGSAGACVPFEIFRESLPALPDSQRGKAVDQYVDCVKRAGHPIIRPKDDGSYRVTFLFRGEASTLTLPSDMSGWNRTSDSLTRIEGTDLSYRSYDLPAAARLDYKFFRDGREWILDPLNPRTMLGGYGPNSHFWTPGYVPPEGIDPDPGIPHGKVERFPFPSKQLGNRRLLHVYLPPGYEAHPETRYPVLFLLDGEDYLTLGAAPNLMDWGLHKGLLSPAILVMAPPVKRDEEYDEKFSRFEKFVLMELVSMIDQKYRTRPDAGSRGVMGVSLSGYAALNLAARNPGVFGRCGAQSTGANPGRFEKLLKRLARLGPERVAFHVDIGLYDLKGPGWSLLETNRRIRTTLETRNVRLQYREVPEGHSWGSWRARFIEALAFFWPPLK